MFIGQAEVKNETTHSIDDHHLKALNRQSRVIKYYGFATQYLNNTLSLLSTMLNSGTGRHHRHHNMLISLLKQFEVKLDMLLHSFNKSKKCKHHLCMHRYNCITYPILV